MIDLHTHTFHSDGRLIPSELVRRAEEAGYTAVAITDHVDVSNARDVVFKTVEVCEALSDSGGIKVIAGAEITHVPPPQIAQLADRIREWGAKLVVLHGETVIEPVAKGTNLSGLKCRIDILAHPGLISEEEVDIAAERGIFLELTRRNGHSITNGHVARLATRRGAPLVLNTDTHGPSDFFSRESWLHVARGAGLTEQEVETLRRNAEEIVRRTTS